MSDREEKEKPDEVNPKVRREIRKAFLDCLGDVKGNEVTDNTLLTTLEKCNELTQRVEHTREGALDMRMINKLSLLAQKKVEAVKTDFRTFDVNDFVTRVAKYLSTNTDSNKEDAESDLVLSAEKWEKLGLESASLFKTAPGMMHMLGALDGGPTKSRRPVKRSKEELPLKTASEKPIDVTAGLKSEDAATTDQVKKVYELLNAICCVEEGKVSPVCFFHFVINPHSFSRTIENIFHTAFLLKDGLAELCLDENDLPVIKPHKQEPGRLEGAAADGDETKNQAIINITMEDWENIKKTFKIRDALIE